MPTARPIIVTMLVMKNDRWKARPSSDTIPSATMMAMIANTIGTTAAARVPNTMIRMTRAARMPMVSACRRSCSAMVLASLAAVASLATQTLKPSGWGAYSIRSSTRLAGARRLPSPHRRAVDPAEPQDDTIRALAWICLGSAEGLFGRVGRNADRPQTKSGLRRQASSDRTKRSDRLAELEARLEAMERRAAQTEALLREHGIGQPVEAERSRRRRASG